MSYSYITKVFPKFQYSNVYDASLYSNITGLNKDDQSTSVNEIKDIPAMNSNLETYKNIEQNPPDSFASQNNLKYYNKQLPSNLLNTDNSNKLNLVSKTEEYTQATPDTSELKGNHEYYIKHILECEQCKDILMKQFNVESDRIQNEQILELISFLMFGLFILLLLNGYKK